MSRMSNDTSTAIRLILSSSLDLFSSMRNTTATTVKSRCTFLPLEKTRFQRQIGGWMQGTEQRALESLAANIEQVYFGSRERPGTLECAILSNGEDLYT